MTTLLHGIPEPLPGERVFAVAPNLAPRVDGTWRRRSHLFTGRALGANALATEQRQRAGLLGLIGQALTPGVIAGLEASLETFASQLTLQVAPGFGVAGSGEDVRLSQALTVPLAELPITITRAGITDTRTLASWRDPEGDRPFDPFPLAAILVLEPIVVRRTGEQDPEDPCEHDDADAAFEDEQLVDAVRLLLVPLPDHFDQPAVSARWRNELAYEIFRQEAESDSLPWEATGVGLALLGFASAAAEPFLDVHAVARDGGVLSQRHALLAGAGTRRLWQARVRQFAEQLGPVDPEALALTPLAAQFRFLPPLGTLPNGAIDVRGDRGEPHLPLPPSALFPETFVLEATPVELESLDDYLRGSASLARIDIEAAEQVQVLVPVPQAYFSPDLLRVEDETPDEFREAIRFFLLLLNHRLGRRDDVRFAEVRLSQVLFNAVTQHAPDAQAVPGERSALFPDDDELPASQVPPPEENYAEHIEDILRAAGRKMALLAGGPVLGQIVEQLLAEAQDRAPEEDHSNVDDAAAAFVSTNCGGIGLVGFVEEVSKRLIAASEALDTSFSRLASNLFEIRQLSSGDEIATQLAISPALPFVVKNRTLLAAGAQAVQFKTFLAAAREPSDRDTPPGPNSPGTFRSAPNRTLQILNRQLPGAENVPAAVTFNESIKQRLESPPALDLADNAARSKRAAFRSLISIHRSGLSLFGLVFRGFRVPQSADPTRDPPPTSPFDVDPRDLREKPVNIQWVEALVRLFDERGYWPHDDVNGLNEGAILGASFESVEHTIAGLRVGEARLAGLERALTIARDQLEVFRNTWNRMQQRLRELDDEIDDYRRDVRVARALEAEEIARARAVNAERREVLRRQVPFLVFRRPRTLDGLLASPTHLAQPALAPDPVPGCLKADFETPDQLRVTVDLLRDAPLEWSVLGAQLLPRINRKLALQQVVQVALHRAANPAPVSYDPFGTRAFDDVGGQAIRRIFDSQRRAIADLRAERLRLPYTHYAGFSWGGLLPALRPVVTLNDVIVSAHGRQEVSDALARHLNDIQRVLACLFERLRLVQPIVRFVWVELLEEARTPVDLRQLGVLPGWESVAPSEQRVMQALVDWLYGRMSSTRDDALRFMHDLIRLTILLCAHAPVNQTLGAAPVNTRPVIAGGVVEIAIASEQLRVGMHVQLFEAEGPVPPAAEGVIEDLSEGIATVRIATTESGRSVLPVRVEVSEPDRNPLVGLANGALVSFGVVNLSSNE